MKARELNLENLKDFDNVLAAASEGLGEKFDYEIKSRKKALEAPTSPRIVFNNINLRLNNLELPSQDGSIDSKSKQEVGPKKTEV